MDPSHGFLGRLAAVSVATVQRALDRLRDLGLLTWQRRLVREGWRVEQTSNAYVLTPEATARACDLQIARPVQVGLIQKVGIERSLALPDVAEAARLALAVVRERRMRALAVA